MSDLSNQLLAQIENAWPRLGIYLRKREDVVNTLAQNAAVSTTGELAAPSRPSGVNVKVSGEIAHITISDAQPLQRGIQYHLELTPVSPDFSAPLVVHLGPTRQHMITLPTNDDGGTPHAWGVRAYSQYQGSRPSNFTYYGGKAAASFAMAGSTNLTPLASTGSGTASSNGQQGGSGLGKVIFRAAPGAKRQVRST